jgi:hypothetical protein
MISVLKSGPVLYCNPTKCRGGNFSPERFSNFKFIDLALVSNCMERTRFSFHQEESYQKFKTCLVSPKRLIYLFNSEIRNTFMLFSPFCMNLKNKALMNRWVTSHLLNFDGDITISFGAWFINMLRRAFLFFRLVSRRKSELVACILMCLNENIQTSSSILMRS